MQLHRTAATIVIAIAALSGCSDDRSGPEVAKPAAQAAIAPISGPTVEATIITVRTVTLPKIREYTHQVVVASGKIRIGDEVDRWRLFDLEQDTVTWVDDITKTFRVHRGDVLRREASAIEGAALPHGIREAEWVRTGGRRNIAGVNAQQYIIRIGAYNRQLWVGSIPRVPEKFLALAFASDMNDGPYRGLMRKVMPAMISLNGFVMLDRSDLPMGTETVSIERTVTAVSQGSIPRGWLAIPPGYRDATSVAITGPSAGRRSASSRQPGRDIREAGSQSSVTTRTVP